MEITKNDKSYDQYKATLSFLELQAMHDALISGGVGPIADEMRKSIEWHLERVPRPGQTKDDIEAAEEAGETQDTADVVDVDIDAADDLLPAPDEDEGEEKIDVDVDVDRSEEDEGDEDFSRLGVG